MSTAPAVVATGLRDERGRVPLLQEEGLESFLEYLRGLIAARAEDDYSALVEGVGKNTHYALPAFLSEGACRAQASCFPHLLTQRSWRAHPSCHACPLTEKRLAARRDPDLQRLSTMFQLCLGSQCSGVQHVLLPCSRHGERLCQHADKSVQGHRGGH